MRRNGDPVTNETETTLEACFRRVLNVIDPDPERGGLVETPGRVARAWVEWTGGYDVDPVTLLKTFEDGAEAYDSLVIVHRIPVYSTCEHHLAPIVGYAHVGYLPSDRVVGLSKLVRVVDAYSRRLQVQERLTTQIADCVQDTLQAKATGVLIRATHGCMSTRGVRVHSSSTTTSALRGLLSTNDALRAEFMSLCQSADQQGGAP